MLTPEGARPYSQHRTRGAAEQRLGLITLFPSTIPPGVSFEIRITARTNIDDALEIVAEVDRVRSVIRELRAAFARSELDGGVKAAPQHPLYIECEERLAALHEQLMMAI